MPIDLHFAYPKFPANTSQSTQRNLLPPPPPCGAHILLHKQTLHNIRLLSTVYNKTKQNKTKRSVQHLQYPKNKTEMNPNNSIPYTTAASRSHMIQRCQVSHKPGLVGDRASFRSWTDWSPTWSLSHRT